MTDTAEPTYMAAPTRPLLRLPVGSCDTHCHVFGPQARYPYPSDVTFRPADAPKEALFALHDMLGIDRCVIVQSGCHGFENDVVFDAMAARPGRCLGIALLPTTVSDEVLADFAARGMRGVRFNFMPHLAATGTPQEVVDFSRRLARHNMHLQIHMAPTLLEELLPVLAGSATPVVIDHMGRIDASAGRHQAAFNALLQAMKDELFVVKVSAVERASRVGAPYADATAFARLLVETFPGRVLWGTDWPHPNLVGGPPDDGALVDLIDSIAPSRALMQALMVDNPARLFRFEGVR